jgi:hypothetical protein
MKYPSAGGIGSLFGQTPGASFSLGNALKSPAGMLALGGGTLFGSQLLKGPNAPELPSQYTDYMNMMMGGGNPYMKDAAGYYQGVLSGQNKDMYEAAGHALEQEYEEQLRGLNSQYKSLRPGTDITTDSAYRRDMQQLQDQYARRKAQVMAQVQQGAASGLAGLGGQQMQGMAQALGPQLDLLAQQWGMNVNQRSALRDSLMGIGEGLLGQAFGIPQQSSFADLFKLMNR